jgi:hypothetical protein
MAKKIILIGWCKCIFFYAFCYGFSWHGGGEIGGTGRIISLPFSISLCLTLTLSLIEQGGQVQ